MRSYVTHTALAAMTALFLYGCAAPPPPEPPPPPPPPPPVAAPMPPPVMAPAPVPPPRVAVRRCRPGKHFVPAHRWHGHWVRANCVWNHRH